MCDAQVDQITITLNARKSNLLHLWFSIVPDSQNELKCYQVNYTHHAITTSKSLVSLS